MKLKVFSIYALIAIIAISFSLTSCGGNKDKENLVKYYNSVIEFVKTPDYKAMLKNDEDWSVKNLDLFKSAGFQVETMEEMQKIIDQNAADPDITKLTEDLALAQQEIQNQVMQEKQAEEEAAAAAAAAAAAGQPVDGQPQAVQGQPTDKPTASTEKKQK